MSTAMNSRVIGEGVLGAQLGLARGGEDELHEEADDPADEDEGDERGRAGCASRGTLQPGEQLGDPSVAGEHGIRIHRQPRAQHEVALVGSRMRAA